MFLRQMATIVYMFTEPEADNCFSIISGLNKEDNGIKQNNGLKHKNTDTIVRLGPRTTVVILKILHLFKYPGLRVMPSKNEKFIQKPAWQAVEREGSQNERGR